MNAPITLPALNIGLIATGDELTQGDILNTNGQFIAAQLQTLGFTIFRHIIVDDDEAHISEAIKSQIQDNDIIIISGGLGPTSDDRTRYALAKAINRELIFDEHTWQDIAMRLKKLALYVDPHNRQQALFPKGAAILANPHGTAAGCHIIIDDKQIFMLPGPPRECLPMFTEQVIPSIKSLAVPSFNSKWLLLGASEGEIAAKLDAAIADLPCRTGYRWSYPYLEFKIYAQDAISLEKAAAACKKLCAPYFISKTNQTALQQVQQLLHDKNVYCYFSEQNLAQLIKMHLLTANNQTQFLTRPTEDTLQIGVHGLVAYWQQKTPPIMSTIDIHLRLGQRSENKTLPVYYRDEQVKDHVIELVCKNILIFYGVL